MKNNISLVFTILKELILLIKLVLDEWEKDEDEKAEV